MARLSLFTWIGNACAAVCGKHGDVTQQSHTAGCSRQTVYDHADKVQQAVADAQLHGPSRQQLLAEVQQLRYDNRQLWDWLDSALDTPKDQQRRFAVTAAAMGLSLQQTLTLLAILLAANRLPSRATLGRWVQQGARRAGSLLKVLDNACQRLVLCLCLDEIFFRRRPVLMGIEPHSMAWVLAQRAADRSGPTWAKAIGDWPAVTDVAGDGGSGLAMGLKLARTRRQEQAAKAKTKAAPLHVRLDPFHIKRDGAAALRLEWAVAEGVWEKAEKISRAKGRYDRRGADRRHFKKNIAETAWAAAEAALVAAEGIEAAWQRACAALEVWRPDGRLTDQAWATAELQAVAAALSGARWAKVRRMLLDRRTLTFVTRLHEELAQIEACPQRREALVALWRWRRSRQSGPAAKARSSAGTVLEASWPEVVCRLLGDGWEKSYRRVGEVLRRVVRASSAVECVNSVLRMHQGRHRNLTQELLDLKRLYWNCRSFVSGKRRKRCPYEHLGLALPSYDLWTLLQTDPEELKQQLSSSGVAK